MTDYRDKRPPATDSMLFALTKVLATGALIFSVFYGVGIPLYLALQNWMEV
jgi:hypothetical protein